VAEFEEVFRLIRQCRDCQFQPVFFLPSSGAFTHDRVSCSARRSRQNCLSEIFLLGHDILNLVSFRLSPRTDREDGLRLSYRLLPNVIVV